MKIIVTGGRHSEDWRTVHGWLDALVAHMYQEPGNLVDLTVVQGGATGVDKFARDWCMKNAVHFVNYPYPKHFGRSGGPIRNREMAIRECPDFVVSFGGGKGTRSMCRIARELDITVINAESHTMRENQETGASQGQKRAP